MNKICPNCGADLNKYIGGNIKFCWSCGYNFSKNNGDTVNIQASWGSGVARINILNR